MGIHVSDLAPIHRLANEIKHLHFPLLHHSITPLFHHSNAPFFSPYLSIYIEQHRKMYLPFSCFHLGSLASCAALWEGLAVLRRDGSENAISSVYLCN
jgi:hypothetical protein